MKNLLIYSTLTTIFSIFIEITPQLYDFCASNEHLHHNKEECLKIEGCCFTSIKSKLDFGQGSDVDGIQDVPIYSCFKIFKTSEKETCEDYREVTIGYGNELVDCKCNDL